MKRNSDGHPESIGEVYTPPLWAAWLLRRYGILERWLAGARVLDPTCGDGAFLVSLLDLAVQSGRAVSGLPLDRLFGIDHNLGSLARLNDTLEERFGCSLPPSNLLHADILFDECAVTADILVGNPPWLNFNDLPADYKERTKRRFVDYGLVPDARRVLLGSSRVDIAALVAVRTITEHLALHGHAYFFLPLSLFYNDGAHAGFRAYSSQGVTFGVSELVDFHDVPVFKSVATRYGVAAFERDTVTQYPVMITIMKANGEERKCAAPLHAPNGPLSVFENREQLEHVRPFRIAVPPDAKPRQGVNTCGANGIFIFEYVETVDAQSARLRSKNGVECVLPRAFLYPLADRETFLPSRTRPPQYVLLPYDEETGKPLTWERIAAVPDLERYLLAHREVLVKRKGMMLGGYLKRGIWWALLGVGRYSFAPYKILWEAYGRTSFKPRVVEPHEGRQWQGNQALHAFIPFNDGERAEQVLGRLQGPEMSAFLDSFRMSGTRSWAQPGRIARVLDYEE